jgi:hypothetical protein
VYGARDGSVTILDFGGFVDERKKKSKKECVLQ